MPPGGIAGADFSGLSDTSASVVRIMPPIETAFSTADRVTFAGSMMPAFSNVLADDQVDAIVTYLHTM